MQVNIIFSVVIIVTLIIHVVTQPLNRSNMWHPAMSQSSSTLSHSHCLTQTCDILQCHSHHPRCHTATESLEHVTSCNVTVIIHIVTQPLNRSNMWHPTMSQSSSILSHSHWINRTCDILRCHTHHPHCHTATESLEHVTSYNVTVIIHIVTQPLNHLNMWHPTMSQSSSTLSHSHWINRTCDILQCHSHHPHCHTATESIEHVTSSNVTLIIHIVTQPLNQSNMWHPTMSHSSSTLSHSHWINRTCDILQCHTHHPHCHTATASIEHVTSYNVTLIMHIVT